MPQHHYLEYNQPESVYVRLLGGYLALETELGGCKLLRSRECCCASPNAIPHDIGFCGSSTIVVNPKSARHA